MPIIAVGIDLAKHVLADHDVDQAGRAELVRPAVARDKLVDLIATLPPCLIGMEACTGAHHWARLFMGHGHSVRLIAPKLVTQYRLSGKRGKNDAADALFCLTWCPANRMEWRSTAGVTRARHSTGLTGWHPGRRPFHAVSGVAAGRRHRPARWRDSQAVRSASPSW